MNQLIVLVLVLNFWGKHSHCDQAFMDIDDTLKEDVKPLPDYLCYCVSINECYPEDISKEAKCMIAGFNAVDPNKVCCRTQPPNPWKAIKKPSQRTQPSTRGPPKKSTEIPTRIPPSQPTPQVPSLTTTQIPTTNLPTQTKPLSSQPQDTSQGSPTNTNCSCMPLGECHDKDAKSKSQQKQEGCPNPNDACCPGPVHKETTPLPQPQPPKPSQAPTQGQPLGTTPRPQSPSPTQPSPPADKTCKCTPFYNCYDEETSSNLTNIVNDRIFIPNSCPNPNDICCYNLDKIPAEPTKDLSLEACSGSCVIIQECPYFSNKLSKAHEGNSEVIKELRRSVCSNTNGTFHVCCPPPPCQFPFIYESVTYEECTTEYDPDGKLWCSTQTDDRNNHVKDQYRLCTADDALVPAGN